MSLSLLLAGCVTVVLPPRDADPDAIAGIALGRAQRAAASQQAVLRQESLDAITTTAARIASATQAWALRPSAFGGGDGSLDGVTLEHLGYPTVGGRYRTPDGTFWLARDSSAVLIHGESGVFNHGVVARVAGTDWGDLSLSVWSN